MTVADIGFFLAVGYMVAFFVVCMVLLALWLGPEKDEYL